MVSLPHSSMVDQISQQSPISKEQAMQRALDDLLARKKQPSQDDLSALSGEMSNIVNALSEALQEGGEIGARKSFTALCKQHPWLVELRNKTVPPRPGTGEQTEEQKQAPNQEEDPRFKTGKNGKKIIVRFTEDDIEALPDKEYLIKSILEKGTVSMIYGPAGTGKTFNALHIAYCVAHGISWLGHSVAKGKVWYINTEGGRGLKPRIAAWRKEYNRGKTSNIEFITWPVHLKEHSQVLLDTVEEADEKPDLLVVDNYSMCATGTNQNDQMEVTSTLMILHKIAQEYGCHCLLVHHSNWTGKVNGSAAFRNHVDTMLDLSRANRESPIILKSEKQRDEEPFADKYLELKTVTAYAHPVTGESITSCVVVTTDAPAKEDTISKKPSEQKMYYILALAGKPLTYTEWINLGLEQQIGAERTLKGAIAELEKNGHVQKDGTNKGAKYSVSIKEDTAGKGQDWVKNRPKFSITDNMLSVLKRMEEEKGQGIMRDDWMQEYAVTWKFQVDGIKNMFNKNVDTLLMNNEIYCDDNELYSTARVDGGE